MMTFNTVSHNGGEVVEKVPCPKCREIGKDRSGNNLVVYLQEAGHHDAYCFACEHYIKRYDPEGLELEPEEKKETVEDLSVLEKIKQRPCAPLVSRKLGSEVTKLYAVRSLIKNGQEIQRYMPITKDGDVVGYKVKDAQDKSKTKCVGDSRGAVELFGQRSFKAGGNILIITAGEEDAMAAWTMTKAMSPGDRGYASVSLPFGHKGVKHVKNNLEWIESFEKVVFAVDQEEGDLKAADEACELLTLGKGRIANFSENDANDMLREGKAKEFYNAVWHAKSKPVSGIVEGADIWNHYNARKEVKSVPFMDEWGLSGITYGLYTPSLVVLTAGTGCGKSTVMKHMQYHLYQTTSQNIGVISLEEPISLCAGIMLGLHMKQRLTLPDVVVDVEEEEKACEDLFGDDRFVFCENKGIRSPKDLYKKIRFMAKSRDCKYIFLDHLTAIVNKCGGGDNKNSFTEHLVNALNDLSQELDICLVLVSHVRKTGDGSDATYETGKVPTEDSIFGSSAIKQYSHLTLAISRDKSEERAPTFIHVLKDRLSGRTGKSEPLFYHPVTGWLVRSLTDKEE